MVVRRQRPAGVARVAQKLSKSPPASGRLNGFISSPVFKQPLSSSSKPGWAPMLLFGFAVAFLHPRHGLVAGEVLKPQMWSESSGPPGPSATAGVASIQSTARLARGSWKGRWFRMGRRPKGRSAGNPRCRLLKTLCGAFPPAPRQLSSCRTLLVIKQPQYMRRWNRIQQLISGEEPPVIYSRRCIRRLM